MENKANHEKPTPLKPESRNRIYDKTQEE